jgi:transcriptional regulator with XRE-family HTH domain
MTTGTGDSSSQARGGIDGTRLRDERVGAGLTLRDLAAKTELSVSLLSQLERGTTSPSIHSLKRIASALGVSIFQLLAEDSPAQFVVRAARRRKVLLQEGDLDYELLSPDAKRKLEVWLGRLEPGASSGPEPAAHDSEEFIFVLHGRLRIEFGAITHELGPGDAIQYDGNQPHMISNAGPGQLEFISALTPPTL